MSRHRNVRSMNYSDEYDGYDDVYGHSVEDDYTISPSDAAFMYDRNRQAPMSAYLKEEDDIAEEDESALDTNEGGTPLARRDSETYQRPALNELDEARLRSCLDEIRNVIGDTVTEHVLVNIILKNDFNMNKSLDEVLSTAASSKQPDDSHAKRHREKKVIGKDQDDHEAPVHSTDKDQHKFIQQGLARLKITPLDSINSQPVGNQEMASLSDTRLNEDVTSRFKENPSKTLSRPKFQFKSSSPHNSYKENLSDDDENCGSLSSLVAQHKKASLTSTNTFSSLADRANQYLKTKPVAHLAAQGGILKSPVLPSVGNLVPSNSSSSERFSQREVNQGDSQTSKRFVIPKLGLSKNGSMDKEVQIDLSCALKPANYRRIKDGASDIKRSVHYEADFVDDNVLERLSTLHRVEEFNCAANARNILNAKVFRKKSLSAFGKVVCRKWVKHNGLPYAHPRQECFKQIISFDFKSPSPDDVIKKHLRKK